MSVFLGAVKKTPHPKTYYTSYSSATNAVYDYVSEKYLIDMNDWFSEVSVGGKPKNDTTKRSEHIRLYSLTTGKEVRKQLNIQVYRISNDTYELNFYIN
jgi:hypothetical protein